MDLSEEEKKLRKKEYDKKRYQENKEKYKLQHKQYYENNNEKCKKILRISKWKMRGVISDNFDELYEYYLNCKNCQNCNVELTIDKKIKSTTRVLDHCHRTGEFRNVLCQSCNRKRN